VRWNQNRTTDPLITGRTDERNRAARSARYGMRQMLPPVAVPSLRAPLIVPDDEEWLVDDWLKVASQPRSCTRATPPGDFTARVMARLETSATVAPQPPARRRATIVEHLCVVGGVFGLSILLVAATCIITALLAPKAVFIALHFLVGGLVFVLVLLGPLVDALTALAGSPSLIFAFLVCIGGALALWSRFLRPAVRLTGEA